jgi:hypothetical protein
MTVRRKTEKKRPRGRRHWEKGKDCSAGRPTQTDDNTTANAAGGRPAAANSGASVPELAHQLVPAYRALPCNSKKMHACDGRLRHCPPRLFMELSFLVQRARVFSCIIRKKKEFSTALHRGGPVNHNEDGAQC